MTPWTARRAIQPDPSPDDGAGATIDRAAFLGPAPDPAPAAAAPSLPGFDPALVGLLYDALSSIAIALMRAAGYTVDQAAVMRFTADEKKALIEPTQRVIDKYADAIGPYRDELTLAMAIGGIVYSKILLLGATVPQPRATAAGGQH